ncbi:MAG: TaqI-like C-terminal specificity domain-containing protein [Spirochaetota bacterium]
MDKEQKIKQLKELVFYFKANIKQYKSANYDEANTRVDFIDKFFELLNWDVRNTSNTSERYRDVIREDRVLVSGHEKAPDYSFRIGGQKKFFVEAKKPGVNISTDIASAYQIRRYGYSAKLPFSVLTDFEEFAVYDTRIKPSEKDSASLGRIFLCTYEEYEKHFDFLYNTFSKTAVLQGRFDDYAETNKDKKGTSEVDEDFLAMLSDWRELLAKKIALRNPMIDIFQLNYAVQKLIDRIIFLRFAEAHDLETFGALQKAIEEPNAYWMLKGLFALADQKYNSGLFVIDDFINGLEIDDAALKEIINNLYYPKCPYEFTVLPIEILGSAYEQFLGKTIRLTPSHQAKIEEKPEVRKAGGVYYTPQYIVNYIVENTVGEKLKSKTQEEMSKLAILDSACGSGSFLIGAYTYLLDWHLEYYSDSKQVKKALKQEKLYQLRENEYRLTIEEKQRILLNNIYGVDIDQQAVEVTRLSLLLKLMEGENAQSAGSLFKHSDFKLLPNLDCNIKCGNSLIQSDFYSNKQGTLFDTEEMRRINAFDWEGKNGFPEIMNEGGFDCVIGNPPYVFTRDEGFTESEKEYFYKKFSLAQYQLNTYIMFTEWGCNLLKNDGRLGFILPNNWLTIDTTSVFRTFVLENCKNKIIVNSYDKVFKDANVDTSILVFSKIGGDTILCNKLVNGKVEYITTANSKQFIDGHTNIINFESIGSTEIFELCSKIKRTGISLNELAVIKAGIKAYEVGKGKPAQTEKMKKERVYHAKQKLDKSYIQYIDGVDVARYFLGWSGQFIKYGENLAAPRDIALFNCERILVRQIPVKPPYSVLASIVSDTVINDLNSMIVKPLNEQYSLKYLLGILNSKMMSFWFNATFGKMQRKLFPQFKVKELALFPIRQIDFHNESDNALHDKLVSLVDAMLKAKKELRENAKTPHEKQLMEDRVTIIDKQIDTLVYNLYGLTEEEIKIVEFR